MNPNSRAYSNLATLKADWLDMPSAKRYGRAAWPFGDINQNADNSSYFLVNERFVGQREGAD